MLPVNGRYNVRTNKLPQPVVLFDPIYTIMYINYILLKHFGQAEMCLVYGQREMVLLLYKSANHEHFNLSMNNIHC